MKTWPHGIYLDTNILMGLPLDVVTGNLDRLLRLADSFETIVYIPQVCYLEWNRRRKEYLVRLLAKTETAIDELHQTFDFKLPEDLAQKKEHILYSLDERTREILTHRKILILKTPEIDLHRLIEMAVNKIRPFEEQGEKGFKDSVILFTLLEHAKTQQDKSHLLITNDRVFGHDDVSHLAEQYKVELIIVNSLSHAIHELESWGRHVHQVLEEYDKMILGAFLKTQFDSITEFVKANCEFTPSTLNQQNQLGFLPQIIQVADIKVLDINSVARETLPTHMNEGVVKISFVAKTNIKVKVRNRSFPSEPRFKMGTEAETIYRANAASVLLGGFLKGESQDWIEEKNVNVDVPVEGSVLLRRENTEKGYKQDKYYQLRLEHAAA